MIKHIVMWKLKDEFEGKSKPELAVELKTKLEALQAHIPQIRDLDVGINFREVPGSKDVVLYTKFDSLADLTFYQQHPEHQLVAQFIRQIVSDRAVVDYEV